MQMKNTDKIAISILLVTYNNEKQIDKLLNSIFHSHFDGGLEVLIWDNDSKDHTKEKVLKYKTKVDYTFSKNNMGFGRAVNKLIEKSKGESFLLLNPDCILRKNTLSKLFEFLIEKNNNAVVCPKLINPDGKAQASVFRLPTITNAIRRYFFADKNAYGKYLPGAGTSQVEVAVMAAMLIPRAVITKIGSLDERFFLYYEDIEFCKRLKDHRIKLYYYPSAVVVHEHGASGKFVSHHDSPLLKSSYIYHGVFYAKALHLVLRLGQAWEKRVLQKFS
jgi:GT2 family glycosyltransferase